MNIVMMTNTYKPILGGLEKSIEVFSSEYRKRGHHVLIVAPEFKDATRREYGVLRVPAIQNFNGTDFSVELPVPNHLFKVFKKFRPDVIHTHHPFLIGDTALRMSAQLNIPIVFTNHTLYEKNTHYVPGDSKTMKKFVVRLATGYANLCDHVIAPSQSVADLLIGRGVRTPVTVFPTGIDVKKFKTGNRAAFRKISGIPQDAFVAGIISRMAPEKNIVFLSQAAAVFLAKNKNAWFVAVGDGPSLDEIKTIFRGMNVESRLVCAGSLKDKQLVNAYHALDVFAFASHSETQGLVLAEAMAAGTPVVAVDAPGVREVVKDQINGRLIPRDNVGQFANALQWMMDLSAPKTAAMTRNARKTAEDFAVVKCVEKVLRRYASVVRRHARRQLNLDDNPWRKAMRFLKAQTGLMTNTSGAAVSSVMDTQQIKVKAIARRVKRGVQNLLVAQ